MTYTGGSGKIGDIFQQFEFTDGLNLLTANAFYRTTPMGRFQFYFGAGAGINVPHVEIESATLGIPETFRYEFGGFSAQALAGVDFRITEHVSLFTEYKLSYSQINAPLNGGYNVQTSVITNQIAAGACVRLGN